MKLRLLLLTAMCVSCFNVLLAEPPSFIQTKDGVIVFTDPAFTGTSNDVKLEVIAAPGKEIFPTQSLVTVYSRRSDLTWNIVPSKDKLSLQTKTLTAIVALKTGMVSFWDAKGKNEATKTITIGDRKGSFNGMLQKRIFRINIISPNKAKSLDFDVSDKEVTYEGKKITVKS